eukprot:CAMPEP_0185336862 /NCGR_PEP_ID=MMETSP1363-20130426/91170_1 /TAXON_ID=38817 /ORGANISM="Gephyrocapsa oceanica, Strain RCC1303" /LENGTH=190 /DNA_ID=CAMNT_0027935967 /DNA_START=139 /DNA_END=711 /DNA_ORIENTATION=+
MPPAQVGATRHRDTSTTERSPAQLARTARDASDTGECRTATQRARSASSASTARRLLVGGTACRGGHAESSSSNTSLAAGGAMGIACAIAPGQKSANTTLRSSNFSLRTSGARRDRERSISEAAASDGVIAIIKCHLRLAAGGTRPDPHAPCSGSWRCKSDARDKHGGDQSASIHSRACKKSSEHSVLNS